MATPKGHVRDLLKALDKDEDFERWLTKHRKDLADYWHHWRFWARDDQCPPAGAWRCWLILAGRGFGKTRTGAEWVRAAAEAQPGVRIALVAATQADARTIMVEGESGLKAIAPAATAPFFEPSRRRLIWPNGTIATLFSAAEPEGLRGPEHHLAWADECAKWDNAEATWDNLALSLRLGSTPQIVATTTPRPVPLIRRLVAAPGTQLTRGRMTDNAINLPTSFLAAMTELYAGTRLARQEIDGQILEEVEGALWTRAMMDRARHDDPPARRRLVLGVDPPAGSHGDACGIIAAALGHDGRCWIMADESLAGASPEGWARRVAEAAERWQADRVIAEANNGGLMVESVLRAAQAQLPVKLVRAASGKAARAEPIAALYERDQVRHAGIFPALEDELCGLTIGGGYQGPGRSPDRADALVWAVTELMLGKSVEPRVRML